MGVIYLGVRGQRDRVTAMLESLTRSYYNEELSPNYNFDVQEQQVKSYTLSDPLDWPRPKHFRGDRNKGHCDINKLIFCFLGHCFFNTAEPLLKCLSALYDKFT